MTMTMMMTTTTTKTTTQAQGIRIPHKKLKQKLMQWSQNIDERVCSVVCLRNVCLHSLPRARSHKNYRHEFQSAFSNNKLGCLFLYVPSVLFIFFRSFFFCIFFILPSFYSFRIVAGMCVYICLWRSFAWTGVIRSSWRGYFFTSYSFSFIRTFSLHRLNIWADTFYILRHARVAFQKWLMRTYIILLIA